MPKIEFQAGRSDGSVEILNSLTNGPNRPMGSGTLVRGRKSGVEVGGGRLPLENGLLQGSAEGKLGTRPHEHDFHTESEQVGGGRSGDVGDDNCDRILFGGISPG